MEANAGADAVCFPLFLATLRGRATVLEELGAELLRLSFDVESTGWRSLDASLNLTAITGSQLQPLRLEVFGDTVSY